MPENNIIKSLVESVCPHCKSPIIIESQMQPPVISSVFTFKDVADAKKDCLLRLETISIDEERKKTIIKWLNDPTTTFGPGEVDSIIESVLKPEE